MATLTPDPTASQALMLIGGKQANAQDGGWFGVANPANGQPLAAVPRAGGADVDSAVEAARRAFPGWRETDAGERGRALRRSDVLVENFRRGVLERLGFPASQLSTLNPRLVVLSITGFGDQGPEADRPGYDQIVQADSGLMSLTGPAPGVPGKIGVPTTDLLAGIHGALGVVSALVRRQRTGRGGIVRTSLLASAVAAHSYHGTNWTVARHLSTGQGPHHPTIAPYGLFACLDGPIQIAAANQSLWAAFAPHVGIDPSDPRYASNARRVSGRETLTAAIEQALGKHTRDHWLATFAGCGIPCSRLKALDEVYNSPQVTLQGLLVEVEHPTPGAISLPGPPLHFDATEPRPHRAPPALGQHSDSIRAWLSSHANDPVPPERRPLPRVAGDPGLCQAMSPAPDSPDESRSQ